MQLRHHRLTSPAPGTTRELVSLHYGTPGAGPKALIQASLHADEVPPMLVAHHLRHLLSRLEAEGRLAGEVVLVPVANPLGLSQQLLRQPIGRFDLSSGQNFNRHYSDLAPRVAELLQQTLGPDGRATLATARAAQRQACNELPRADELASLRRTLMELALDADTVLDLHCDHEAVVHLYTATPLWPQVAPLAQLLGAPLTLLATQSGDEPFDEACSMFWPRLAECLGPAGAALPAACVAVTVELRGEADVDHALAERDAQAIVDYLAVRGVLNGPVAGDGGSNATARPLAGSQPLVAPHGGVLVYHARLGAELRAGEPVAEVVDPLTGASTTRSSPIDGLFYARIARRFVHAGHTLAKVAGHVAQRQGKLLSA